MNWLTRLLQKLLAKPQTETLLLDLAADEAPLPPKGRSSVEERDDLTTRAGALMQEFSGLNPDIPFEWVEFIQRLALVNPNISHALSNLVSMANNGHHVNIDAANDGIVERAYKRLNEQAYRLYPLSSGIDGLINHYIEQVALTGAISSEDVVTPALDGVERIAIVPTHKIRFKYKDGQYIPYQQVSTGDLVELNPRTYNYYAFRTSGNSPYGIPLYMAAMDSILTQRDMQKNFKYIMRKFGLLGLVAMTLKYRRRAPNETETEYAKSKNEYLNKVLFALKANYMQGLMVKFDDQTIEHFNITAQAQGVKEIWKMNEQAIASGMQTDGVMVNGETNSTETFANVTYMFITRQANNVRQLAKRRMEKTYRLDLALQGIPVMDISFRFNENPARKPLDEAQAQAQREAAILKKAQFGVIDPDTAAQEMGYSAWYDPARLDAAGNSGFVGGDVQPQRRKFTYDQNSGRYLYSRPRLGMISLQRGSEELASERTIRRLLEKFGQEYLQAIEPFLKNSVQESLAVLEGFIRRSRLSQFRDADDFAQQAFNLISEVYVDAFRPTKARRALQAQVKKIYEYYRIEDDEAVSASGVRFSMTAEDRRVMDFMRRIDRFYLSKYIFNESTESTILDFLKKEFIENGEGIFDRTSAEMLERFIQLAGDTLEPLSGFEAKRIITTSVQRMRSWANIFQMEDAGFEYAQVWNPSPVAEICIYMSGRLIPVSTAAQAVSKLASQSPEQFAAGLKPITPARIQAQGVASAVAAGEGFPPYHPNCKTRLIATDKKPEDAQEGLRALTNKQIEDYLARIGTEVHACEI